MAEIPFIGSSYKSRSAQFDSQMSVNVYPIKSESGTSKNVARLQGSPGKRTFLTFPKFPVRMEMELNGRAFAIGGNGFYEIYPDGTYLERGQLNTSRGPVSFDTNGTQICMVDDPDGYIFDLSDDTFQQITDPYYIGATTVTFLAARFVFSKPTSGVWFCSAVYDGLTGDPLEFASAEGSPDNLTAVKAVHQQVWLFGGQTTEIWTPSGGADFPFTPVQGSLMEYGCVAPYSVKTSANTVFWLGRDQDGQGIVFMASGYQPQRISTHAIEDIIQEAENMSEATAFTYQESGSYFYCLNVGGRTWCYDVTTQEWHERASFVDGGYQRDRAECHIFAYGRHLVGDYDNGKIYEQSLNIYRDDDRPLRAMRRSPTVADKDMLNEMSYHRFQLDMEVGIGLDGTTEQPDYNPQVMLRWSDDGGVTWSNERWVSAGKLGNYKARANWRQLGRGRSRVFEVVFDANCMRSWIAAHVDVTRGNG